MTVQIRELIVKASIREEREERQERTDNSGDHKEEIIEESTERVLQILKNKNER